LQATKVLIVAMVASAAVTWKKFSAGLTSDLGVDWEEEQASASPRGWTDGCNKQLHQLERREDEEWDRTLEIYNSDCS
jgi:hypothetical protein